MSRINFIFSSCVVSTNKFLPPCKVSNILSLRGIHHQPNNIFVGREGEKTNEICINDIYSYSRYNIIYIWLWFWKVHIRLSMYNIQENACIMCCTYCSSYNKCAAEWVAPIQEHIGQDSPLKPMILNHVHSSPSAGHSSYMLHRAKQNFYWEDMKKDLNRQSTSAKSVIGSKLRPLLPLDYHSPCLFQLGLGQISAWISLMDYQSHRIICCSCGSLTDSPRICTSFPSHIHILQPKQRLYSCSMCSTCMLCHPQLWVTGMQRSQQHFGMSFLGCRVLL